MKSLFISLKKVWKLVVLFLLIMITFSYAMFQGGFVSWFLFYSFVPFALYSLLLFFYPLHHFEAVRIMPRNEWNAGESLNVSITLKRKSRFPLFFMVAEDCFGDQIRLSQEMNLSKTILIPGFKKEMIWEYKIPELPRGEHFFYSIRLKSGDPIGLIEKEIHLETDHKIMVYPAYEELIYKPLENHFDQGMTASRERVQRDTSMAVGIREYQPGDRFSWINWKASARRNVMMTKEFEQRQSHDVYLLMDCTPSNRFETIVSFTASVMKAMLKKGAHVGFLSSSQERVAFPIRGGENQQTTIFYHLAKVRDDSPVSFDRVLEAEGVQLQQHNLMLITGQLTQNIVEKAGQLTGKNGSVTIFIIKNESEAASKNELAFKGAANARGIRAIFVHSGNFKEVFSEVARI